MLDNRTPAVALDMSDWVSAFSFANQLVRQNKPVMLVTSAFDAAEEVLSLGSLVVPIDSGIDHGNLIAAAGEACVRLKPVETTLGVVMHALSDIRVGLYGGGGAPFNHASVLAAAGFRLRFISDAEIRAGQLSTIDVLVMPGGGFRAMHGQLEPLGLEGARAIADWVRAGGMYVGSCAGAFDCAIASDNFGRSCPPKAELELINARVWNEGFCELDGLQSPGVGLVMLENTNSNHPVMFGMPTMFPIVHYNGPIFEALSASKIEGASLASELARFAGSEAPFTHAEDFMGTAIARDDTVLDRAVAARRASIVTGELGIGKVVAFGSHPEFGFDLAMREWADPARLLVNAAIWQAASRSPAKGAPWSHRDISGPVAFPARAKFNAIESAAAMLIGRVDAIRQRTIDPLPSWLSRDYAMSFFGKTPLSIWTESLDELDHISQDVMELSASLHAKLDLLAETPATEPLMSELNRQVDAWILDRRDPTWGQDGGYEGVLQLIGAAIFKCNLAIERWDKPIGPPAGPYAYFQDNPYHLVAGSYLAAIGCAAGAMQLLRSLNAEASLVIRLTHMCPASDDHTRQATTVDHCIAVLGTG